MQAQLREIMDNHNMGLITEQEYFNQFIDILLRGLAIPNDNKEFQGDYTKVDACIYAICDNVPQEVFEAPITLHPGD